MREALQAVNRTNFEHAGYAVAMQLGTLLLFWWVDIHTALAAGTMLGIGFFVGREHAQAENRWKKEWGKGSIWNAFDLRRWNWDSRWDLIFPIVACSLAAGVMLAVLPKSV